MTTPDTTEKKKIEILIGHIDAEYGKDWVWRVDPESLAMHRGSSCVLGQLETPPGYEYVSGSYQIGTAKLKKRISSPEISRQDVDVLTASHTGYWRTKIVNLRGERMNVRSSPRVVAPDPHEPLDAKECIHNALAAIRAGTYKVTEFGTVNGIIATLNIALSDLEKLS